MKDCRGKERGDGQRLRLSLRRTKRLEVEKGRAAPTKRRVKGRKWWRRKEGKGSGRHLEMRKERFRTQSHAQP
jgi:hypothetical protein